MVVFMKVLSLREPFASLIKEGVKKVETRSWKTNYRGEIYIHASITKAKNDERDLFSLLQNTCFLYGHIICKCKLVDCVYMSKEYVNEMKMKNPIEYKCGLYEEGRYAWILEKVEIINPIKASGQLGIWDYYEMNEVMKIMNDISYGWIDKNKIKHFEVDDLFSDNYCLQSPQELLASKLGVCWDQVELERYFFKTRDIQSYFICFYNNEGCPSHTFLVIKENNLYYWFEHSWYNYKGIHKYKTLKALLSDVKDKFIKDNNLENSNLDNLTIREYSKPKYNLSVQEFYAHCEKGELIVLD